MNDFPFPILLKGTQFNISHQPAFISFLCRHRAWSGMEMNHDTGCYDMPACHCHRHRLCPGPGQPGYRYRKRVLVDNSSPPTCLSSLRQKCNVLCVTLMICRSLVTLTVDTMMTLDSRQQQLVFVVCLPSEYFVIITRRHERECLPVLSWCPHI